MVNVGEKKMLIEDKKARTVTFSKRRFGLFKKASELSALCGAEMAIIVFSPSGRPYAFGSPSVETIIDRCTNSVAPAPAPAREDKSSKLAQLYKEYADLQVQLEAEKKRGEELRRRRRHDFPDVTKMNWDQLCEYKAKLENLQKLILDHHEISNKKPAISP